MINTYWINEKCDWLHSIFILFLYVVSTMALCKHMVCTLPSHWRWQILHLTKYQRPSDRSRSTDIDLTYISNHYISNQYLIDFAWWRHQMETFSTLLALCVGNLPPPPPKDQCRGALMFSLIYAWINGWVNNHEAGDLSSLWWLQNIPDSKVHGAHLGPTGPRWAPCWPHELCYLG